jgi:hypothetical protein
MTWLWLSLAAFVIPILVPAGMAGAQIGYEVRGQGQQPLQSELANRQQQGLNGPKAIDKPASKAKKAPSAKWGKKDAKSAKGAIFKPGFSGKSSKGQRFEQAKEPQIGGSESDLLDKAKNYSSRVGSNSFLDGYLLQSLHDDGARKKMRSSDKPNNNLLKWKTTSRY